MSGVEIHQSNTHLEVKYRKTQVWSGDTQKQWFGIEIQKNRSGAKIHKNIGLELRYTKTGLELIQKHMSGAEIIIIIKKIKKWS